MWHFLPTCLQTSQVLCSNKSLPYLSLCLLLNSFLHWNKKDCSSVSPSEAPPETTLHNFSTTNVVQPLNGFRLFATPWTSAHQASLFIIISQSLCKLMSTELMMPSNHLVLCHPLLLPSIFPRISVFSNESALCIRWPKYWSFSISHSNEYSGLISFRTDWYNKYTSSFQNLCVIRTHHSLT